MNTTLNKISEIKIDLFLKHDFFLYEIADKHQLIENSSISIPFRSGKSRIEYNETLCSKLSVKDLERLYINELIRCASLHPYQRKPKNVPEKIILLASDISLGIKSPEEINLGLFEIGISYEKCIDLLSEISMKIVDSDNDNNFFQLSEQQAKEATELWEENQVQIAQIKISYDEIMKENNLKGGTNSSSNFLKVSRSDERVRSLKQVLFQFIGSIKGGDKIQTRMRPNRRLEWLVPGSKKSRRPVFLIAIDVSGSISQTDKSVFYSTIKKIQNFGYDADVLTFDFGISKAIPLKKYKSCVQWPAGGGTLFQPVFDFFIKNQTYYDGVLILTDGAAEPPKTHIPINLVLWCFLTKSQMITHKIWAEKLGRITFLKERE